jgi:hypothetical protein
MAVCRTAGNINGGPEHNANGQEDDHSLVIILVGHDGVPSLMGWVGLVGRVYPSRNTARATAAR